MTEQVQGRAYGGMTAAERDAHRRQRLLATATELIGTDGYASTTIPRICSTAKVSTRHFYELYATKEDLFVDLYDQITAASYSRVAASLEATVDAPMAERVAAAILAYLDPMLEDARVARIAFVEIMGASPRIETVRLRYRDTLVDVIRTEVRGAVDSGEIADRDWRFAGLALVGAVTAIVYDWALRDRHPSRQVLEGQLAQLAVTLLTD